MAGQGTEARLFWMQTDLEGGWEWAEDGAEGSNGIGFRDGVGLGSKMLLEPEMVTQLGSALGVDLGMAMD